MIRILEIKHTLELSNREAWELYRELVNLPGGLLDKSPKLIEIYLLLQRRLEPPEESAKCVTINEHEVEMR